MSSTDVSGVMMTIEPSQSGSNADAGNKAPVATKRKAKQGKPNKRFKSQFGQAKTSVLSGVPIKTTFQVYTCNNVSLYSRTFYKVLIAADSQISSQLTSLQCEYVLTMSHLNRMVQTGIKHGYSFPLGSEILRIASQHILLPDFLCKYIESIGVVEIHGYRIGPWIDDYRVMMSTNSFRDPKQILEEAQRPVPNNIWKVDRSWITDYNIAIARVNRLRLGIRQVIDSTAGRNELLVGYSTDEDFIKPYAPANFSGSEFQLGASYKFRCYDNQREWPGPDNYILPRIFQCETFDPNSFVASHMTESLVMRTYQATH